MRTKTLDQLKHLNEQAKAMAGYFDAYDARTSESRCDKYGAAFGDDSRFRVFSLSTGFDAHTGDYGSSGCSTFGHYLSAKTVEKYMLRAMNQHKRTLFVTAAELMRIDAEKLTGEAEAELASLQQMLASAKAG